MTRIKSSDFCFLRLIFFIGLVSTGPASLSPRAQVSPEVQKLTTDSVKQIARFRPQRILIAPRQGCLLDTALCESSERALRGELEKAIPGAQFVPREELISQVMKQGLLAIDAFDPLLLMSLAPNTGAQVLVAQDLEWEGNHYELSNVVDETSTSKSPSRIRVKVSPSISGEDPLVYQDPASGVALIVVKQKNSGFRVFRFPVCDKCPQPKYLSSGAPGMYQYVQFRVTITEQGTVDQIAMMGSGRSAFSDKAIEAIKGWAFKPAINSDGKPFAVRTYINITLGPTSVSSGIRF
jgi:TonB family protein